MQSNYYITFLATFFGAMCAFSLNWIRDYIRERDRQHTISNKFAQIVGINSNRLLGFKKQLLSAHLEEFIAMKALVLKFLESRDQVYWDALRIELDDLAKKDGDLNGILKRWEDLDFLYIDVMELSFLNDDYPDTLRWVDTANEQLKKFTQENQIRNKSLKKFSGFKDVESIRIFYESILHREQFLQYTNIALVLLSEALSNIIKYKERHFPKENILKSTLRMLRSINKQKKWLFKIEFSSDEYKQYMPSSDTCADILGFHYDKEKKSDSKPTYKM